MQNEQNCGDVPGCPLCVESASREENNGLRPVEMTTSGSQGERFKEQE